MKFLPFYLFSLLTACTLSAAPEHSISTIFTAGDGYAIYRIPAIVRANDGTLLAFCEGRASIADSGNIDIVLKRSTDNGDTWGPLILVQEEGGTAPITIGNPAPVVDRDTGNIHMLFCRENDTVFHTVSTDNGATWAARTEITANVKLSAWGWYATGPCHGVQLTRGAHAGRLVVAANHRVGANGSDSGSFGGQILYSDDKGVTWQMTAHAGEINGTGANESTVLELNSPGVAATSTTTHSATDVPKSIAANSINTVTSSHTLANVAGNITDVNVSFTINHTYDDDLEISLVHPDGTTIDLSSRNGSFGDNYSNTTIDQQASVAITAGSAPFTGTYRPEGDLNVLNGKSANGVWQLRVRDVFAVDGGALTSWSLEVTTDAPVTSTELGSHIYVNSRDYGSDAGNRSEAFSGNGGTSYTTAYNGNPHFITPICQGSLARFRATDEGDATNRIIFSCPNGSSRSNGSLWISDDEAQTWSQPKTLFAGAYAYSDMTKTASQDLGVIFETGTAVNRYDSIQFIRVNEEWLNVPPPMAENPAAAFWSFEEKEVGETAVTSSASILDVDAAGKERNMTPSQAFAYASGSSSYTDSTAISFAANGSLQIADVDTENNFDFASDDDFSIEASFRIPNGHSASGAILSKDLGPNQPSWWLRVESGGNLRFLVSDNSSEAIASSGATLVNDGNWHHVVALRDGTNKRLKMYLDGVEIANVADGTTGSHANSQALVIGGFNGGIHQFMGEIDFVRITPTLLDTSASYVTGDTQLDVDADSIPDDFERDLVGGTASIGVGDADGDGVSDLLEYATGSAPNDVSSTPVSAVSITNATTYEFTFHKRSLPSWLTLTPQYSTDLDTWGSTLPGATISFSSAAVSEDVDEYTYMLSFPGGALPAAYFSLIANSTKTP